MRKYVYIQEVIATKHMHKKYILAIYILNFSDETPSQVSRKPSVVNIVIR
jgi:hypothetical protein